MGELLKVLQEHIHEFSGKHKNVDNVMVREFIDNVSSSLQSIIADHRASCGKRPSSVELKRVFCELSNTVESFQINNDFTKHLSPTFFDILFDPELQSWILKEILKVYLKIIRKSDRSVRVSVTEETGFNYLGKLMDLIFHADYDFQNMIVETIFRMSNYESLRKFEDVFCFEEDDRKAFFSITSKNFDRGSRQYLNIVNRKGDNVLSVLCHKVSFDLFDLRGPPELEDFKGLWIDFNCKIGTITFFINNALFINSPDEDSWEMVTILPEIISDAQLTYASGKEPGKNIGIGKITLKSSVILSGKSHNLKDCRTLVLYSSDVKKLQRIFHKVIPSMCKTDFLRKKTHFSNKVYRPLKMNLFKSSSLSRSSSNASSIERPFNKEKNRKSDFLSVSSMNSSLCSSIMKRRMSDKQSEHSLDDAEAELKKVKKMLFASKKNISDGKIDNSKKFSCGLSLDTWMAMEQKQKNNTEPTTEETKNSSIDSRKIFLGLLPETHTTIKPVHNSSFLLEKLLNEPIPSTCIEEQSNINVITRRTVFNSSVSSNETFVEMKQIGTATNIFDVSKNSERDREIFNTSSISAELDEIYSVNMKQKSPEPSSNVLLKKNADVCALTVHQNERTPWDVFCEIPRSGGFLEEDEDDVHPFDALLMEKRRETSVVVDPEIGVSNEPNFMETVAPFHDKETVTSTESFKTSTMDPTRFEAESFQYSPVIETATEIFETAEDDVNTLSESVKLQEFQDIPDVNFLSMHKSYDSSQSESRARLKSRAKVLSNTLIQPAWKTDQYKFNVELSSIKESRVLSKSCKSDAQSERSHQNPEPQGLVFSSTLIGQASQDREGLDKDTLIDSKNVEKSLWELFKDVSTPPKEPSEKVQDEMYELRNNLGDNTNNLEYSEHMRLLTLLDSQETVPENMKETNEDITELNIEQPEELLENTDKHPSKNDSISENSEGRKREEVSTNQAIEKLKIPDEHEAVIVSKNISIRGEFSEIEILEIQENENELESTSSKLKTNVIDKQEIHGTFTPEETELLEMQNNKTLNKKIKQSSKKTTLSKSRKRKMDTFEEDTTHRTTMKKLKKTKTHEKKIDIDKKFNLKKRDTTTQKFEIHALTLSRNASTTSSKSSKRRLYDPTVLPDNIPCTSVEKTNEKKTLVRSPSVEHLLSEFDKFLERMSKRTTIYEPRTTIPKPTRETETKHGEILDFSKYDLKEKGRKKLRELRNKPATTSINHSNDRIFEKFFASSDKFRRDFEGGRIGKANAAAKKKLMEAAQFLINLI